MITDINDAINNIPEGFKFIGDDNVEVVLNTGETIAYGYNRLVMDAIGIMVEIEPNKIVNEMLVNVGGEVKKKDGLSYFEHMITKNKRPIPVFYYHDDSRNFCFKKNKFYIFVQDVGVK